MDSTPAPRREWFFRVWLCRQGGPERYLPTWHPTEAAARRAARAALRHPDTEWVEVHGGRHIGLGEFSAKDTLARLTRAT